jgi:hypothetical protein
MILLHDLVCLNRLGLIPIKKYDNAGWALYSSIKSINQTLAFLALPKGAARILMATLQVNFFIQAYGVLDIKIQSTCYFWYGSHQRLLPPMCSAAVRGWATLLLTHESEKPDSRRENWVVRTAYCNMKHRNA